MTEERILVVKVTNEQYEKLKAVSDHITSSPDHVATLILKATLNDVSWKLEHLKEVLSNEITT